MATFKVSVKIPEECHLESLFVNYHEITDFTTTTTFEEDIDTTYLVESTGIREGLDRVKLTIVINGKEQPIIFLPPNPSASIINFSQEIIPIT